VEITDLAATVEGMVLGVTPEEMVATMDKRVLEGIREGTDLEATMVGLVLEEETVSLGVQIAGEVPLVLEVI
jgi:hypothetical protein